MRVRFGKCFNSIGSKCCIFTCIWWLFNEFICRCLTCKSRQSQQNQQQNQTKPLKFKEYMKLIYYTFFFNQSSDSLVAVETMLQPFMGTMNFFMRYFGKVRRLNLKQLEYLFSVPFLL